MWGGPDPAGRQLVRRFGGEPTPTRRFHPLVDEVRTGELGVVIFKDDLEER
jgi:hypothetical protein